MVSIAGTGTQYWHYADLNGHLILDDSGALTTYDPFGQPLASDGSMQQQTLFEVDM